jgi:purine-nucleoside phosphorylase
MYGYTGTYRGQKISVQGSGWASLPWEFTRTSFIPFYGVDRIIRIGTGAMRKSEIEGYRVAMGASTDSGFASQFSLPGDFAPLCSFPLWKSGCRCPGKKVSFHVGNVITTDVFYNENEAYTPSWAKMGILPWKWRRRGFI